MRRALVAITALALLGGCSTDTTTTATPTPSSSSVAATTGIAQVPKRVLPPPKPVSTVIGTVTGFFTAAHKGEFTKACRYLTADAIAHLEDNGTPCPVAISTLFDKQIRALMTGIQINMSWSCPNGGESITLPGEAITFAGGESRVWRPTTMIRLDSEWLIQPDWFGVAPLVGETNPYHFKSMVRIPTRPPC